jgi:hypothetical protein
MSEKFQIWMDAIDDDLLEEAITPVRKRNYLPWISIAVAACLLLMIGLPMLPDRAPAVTFSVLSEMGYHMTLPEEAEQIRYEIITLSDRKGAQASFVMGDTAYVYQEVKTPNPQPLSDNAGTRPLTWNVGSLDIQLLSSDSGTAVSWYLRDDQTQGYLTANTNTRNVLTTASQILRITGLDVTVAPENAENITYDAFLLDGRTVAETTFRIDGITYSYRMAATLELREDFADISGLNDSFAQNAETEVFWCSAKLSFHEGGQGKIIWFDLVPGILYSLSMDSGASQDALLSMASRLFEPAQENN